MTQNRVADTCDYGRSDRISRRIAPQRMSEPITKIKRLISLRQRAERWDRPRMTSGRKSTSRQRIRVLTMAETLILACRHTLSRTKRQKSVKG